MYLIHGVKGVINMSHQLLWTMDHVMVHAGSVDRELYIISVTLRYHTPASQLQELPNGTPTKQKQGRQNEQDRASTYQQTRPIK